MVSEAVFRYRRSMKIALAQFNPTVGDFEGNARRILELGREAKSAGADIAVFSELCLCGYPPQDLIERPAFVERNQIGIQKLASDIALPSVVGYVGKARESTGKPVANAAALIYGGKVLFEQQKMLLPTYDVFDETRYFQPAVEQQMFTFEGQRLGIAICEDFWNDKSFWPERLYERDPVTEMMGKNATVLLNLSSSPYTAGKRELRQEMLAAIANNHKVPVVYVNQVGGNDSLIFDGTSVAYTSNGKLAARAKSFDEDLVYFDSASGEGDIRPGISDEIDAIYRALVLGTRDYVRKCGFSKVVIGLSGGIDSALVATIAVDALGKENVLGVTMPGPYSSEGSVADSRRLAENLGIRLEVLPISKLATDYGESLSGIFAGRAVD